MQMVKVFGLMAAMTVLVVLAGQYLGGSNGAMIAFGFAAISNVGMYWFSDRAVLKMYKAQVVTAQEAPELYAMVDRLRQAADLPMPVVAIAPQQQPNAFATGRNPAHAVVCVTEGILQALDARQLEGVLAHEIAHVKHRHMLVGTFAATMAGAITVLASIARWGMIFGGFGGRDGNRNGLGTLVMMIVAPIAAMIVQAAVSRQNEFQADRTAAELTRDPDALAAALTRIDGYAKQIPMNVNPAAAHLAIINPLKGTRQTMGRLFSTHPPTEERVARLREMRGQGAS